ncbi:MAG: thiamine diphosphokinase [Syntrophomonadaceae bacterium]|nr:thiamine diphosphokinase [Syntrophomonadaceae bacterium]
MRRCVLVANGNWQNPEWHAKQLRENDFLVGIDGGAQHLYQLGRLPDLVVGDLDSLDAEVARELKAGGCQFVVYPPEKDLTDTQIALDLVKQRGFRDILLLGALGCRIDHLLSNLFSLVPLVNDGMRIKLADPEQSLWLFPNNELKIEGVPGQVVSLLALTPVTGITTNGLKYPLQDATLDPFCPYAISNELIGNKAKVSWSKGVLLGVCFSRPNHDYI